MSCNLCNQYAELLSFHDVGRKINEFLGSPHEKYDMIEYSKSVEIDYTKIEYKHEEELYVSIKFMCANMNLIYTMELKNHTDMNEENVDFNYNTMMSIVDIINELKLKVKFEGRCHVRHRKESEMYCIESDEVLIHNIDGSLSYIYMSVY